MSIIKSSFDFDNFAENACDSIEELETDIWLSGLPGLIATLRGLIKINWNDRTRLANLIANLCDTYSVEFVDQFIQQLTGRDPDIHVFHEAENGELILIEDANL